VYADQIEYMDRHLEDRDAVILSVHPHSDRGTGVACAELAVPAGAQRVEGCLFGNGERTGNVDLVSLAPNLHAQGVDPMIDLSDIDWFVERWSTATEFPSTSNTLTAATSCTRRSPAPIRMRSRRGSRSQSGKGGIADLLQSEYGVTLPRRLQIDFAAKVQEVADSSGLEITAEQLWTLFCAE
jgi:2-isopropylmalate synthase